MTLFSNLFRQKRTRIELDLTDAQITQLRAVMDGLPLNRYAPLVLAVLPNLPLENGSASVATSAPDAAAAPNPPQGRGSFSLVGFTNKGKAALPELTRLLSRLPHGTGDM